MYRPILIDALLLLAGCQTGQPPFTLPTLAPQQPLLPKEGERVPPVLVTEVSAAVPPGTQTGSIAEPPCRVGRRTQAFNIDRNGSFDALLQKAAAQEMAAAGYPAAALADQLFVMNGNRLFLEATIVDARSNICDGVSSAVYMEIDWRLLDRGSGAELYRGSSAGVGSAEGSHNEAYLSLMNQVFADATTGLLADPGYLAALRRFEASSAAVPPATPLLRNELALMPVRLDLEPRSPGFVGFGENCDPAFELPPSAMDELIAPVFQDGYAVAFSDVLAEQGLPGSMRAQDLDSQESAALYVSARILDLRIDFCALGEVRSLRAEGVETLPESSIIVAWTVFSTAEQAVVYSGRSRGGVTARFFDVDQNDLSVFVAFGMALEAVLEEPELRPILEEAF
ncbi:MAG: hypothetical protein AAFY02_07745 [Pseudomonadota bacterium]